MFWVIVIVIVIVLGVLYNFRQREHSTKIESHDETVCLDDSPIGESSQPLPWINGDLLVVGIGTSTKIVLSSLINDNQTKYPILLLGDSEDEIEGVPFCNISLLPDDVQREGHVPTRYETNIKEVMTALVVSDHIRRVLIVSVLGGLIETSLFPVVVKIAKDLQMRSYALATTPFKFERSNVQNLALNCIKSIYQDVSGFYCLNLEYTAKDAMHSFDIADAWMIDLLNCIAYDTRGLRGRTTPNQHIGVPYVLTIKDGEDWVELINNFTSEYAISKTGIDFQSTPVLKVFFVLGETSLSVQSAREIMDLFENWSEEPTFTECYFISDRVKGPSRIVLMAERVEWDAFYEGVQLLYKPTEEEIKRKEYIAKIRKIIFNAHHRDESVLKPSDCGLCPDCDHQITKLTGKVFTYYDEQGNIVLKRIRGFCHKRLVDVDRNIIMNEHLKDEQEER